MNQEEKEKLVVDYFMDHPTKYIKDIADEVNIPRSTVQRYLEKYKKIKIKGQETTIEEQLKQNKRNGQKEGGLRFFEKNDSIKSEDGRFIGSMITDKKDKEKQKQRDIIIIANYYLENATKTLSDIASELEEIGPYTRDYVYDCLKDSRLVELIGIEKTSFIQTLLKRRKTTSEERESVK